MERQVQLRNKIFITALSFSLSCGHNNTVVPSVFIDAGKNLFMTKQGITYLNDQPFSGWSFALYDANDTAFVIPYSEGKEAGIARSWYENKQLKEERYFEK